MLANDDVDIFNQDGLLVSCQLLDIDHDLPQFVALDGERVVDWCDIVPCTRPGPTNAGSWGVPGGRNAGRYSAAKVPAGASGWPYASPKGASPRATKSRRSGR